MTTKGESVSDSRHFVDRNTFMEKIISVFTNSTSQFSWSIQVGIAKENILSLLQYSYL
jgi:hypothetical protein